MNCRHCGTNLEHTFVDLGYAPPSNAYLRKDDLARPEVHYPLRVKVCHECWLVQTEDFARPDELFAADYAYFSSTSASWVAHARDYASSMIARLKLDKASLVIEIASNDGYLLKHFVARDIPCIGIEPTDSTAAVAESAGVPVIREFFGEHLGKRLAAQGRQADLVIGNNVYAHVPDINDFTLGLKSLLKPGGTVTLEFPHLLQLLTNVQFDTIYHEHFSYLSLWTVSRVFAEAGLRVFDVEELPTHGGSLRVFGCHAERPVEATPAVAEVLADERSQGLQSLAAYQGFQPRVDSIKNQLLGFLLEQKRRGRQVLAYGAAAKGNTLLNYAGVRPDLLAAVFDAAPAKQEKFLPGSHIPVLPSKSLLSLQPDYLLVLPWNLYEEIRGQLASLGRNGTKFVTALPELTIS